MVSRWVHVADGLVVNVSLWDGNLTTWQPPIGHLMVPIDDESPVGIGYTYDGATFTAPAPIEVEVAPMPVVADAEAFTTALANAVKATTTSTRLNALLAALSALDTSTE